MKIIFTLLLVLSTVLNAQNYTELFKNDLPKMVIKNTTYQSSFNYNIEKYWFANPDLVYFYFQHLNQKFEQKNNDSRTNYFNFLWNKYNASVDSNAEINQKRIYYSKNTITNGRKRSLILNYLENQSGNAVGNDRKSNDFSLDSTYSNYLIYKMATNNSETTFDKETNYYSLCKESLKKTMEFFEIAYSTYEQYTSEQLIDVASKAHFYYFLFNDAQTNKFNLKMNIGFTDFLNQILEYEYKNSSKFKISVATSVTPIIISESGNHQDKYFDIISTPYDISVYSWSGLEIGLGIELPLKDEIGLFSSIDLNIYTSTFFFSIDNSDYSKVIIPPSIYVPRGKRLRAEFQSGEYSTKNMYRIGIQIATPVYYFSNTTQIYAGVHINASNLGSFSIKKTPTGEGGGSYYTYGDKEIDPYDIDIKNKFTVSPLLILKTSLNSNFNLKFEIAPIDRGMIGLEYFFKT